MWCGYFAQVSGVSVKVVSSVVNSILEVAMLPLPKSDQSAALSAVPGKGDPEFDEKQMSSWGRWHFRRVAEAGQREGSAVVGALSKHCVSR